MLPHAAKQPIWWSDARSTARGFLQSAAWLDAGYIAEPARPLNSVYFRRRISTADDTHPRARLLQAFDTTEQVATARLSEMCRRPSESGRRLASTDCRPVQRLKPSIALDEHAKQACER